MYVYVRTFDAVRGERVDAGIRPLSVVDLELEVEPAREVLAASEVRDDRLLEVTV